MAFDDPTAAQPRPSAEFDAPPDLVRALMLGGEMGGRIATFDWSTTSLGPLTDWPQSLKTALGVLLLSPIPMTVVWGEEGVLLYNDGYAVIAGQRHPGLLGCRVREGWPEAAAFNDNVLRVCLSGGALSYKDLEFTLNRSGAAERAWFNLDYSPVFDESGRPGGVVAIIVETTKRVLAERRQAGATERQRRQFEQAPGFIAVMSGPDHRVEFVNDAHRRVFGSDDWVGKTIRSAFPSIDGQGFFELLDRVYTTGSPYEIEDAEVRYRRSPDAEEELRYLSFIYAPVTDDDGVVTGVFCDGFDVTATHRAQSALRETEAQLRTLNAELEQRVAQRTQARGRTWQLSPDLMGGLNADGYFETSNPAWRTMLGWSEEEVAGTSIFDLLHPDDVERTRTGFALTLKDEQVSRHPNRYRCKDGSYRWISWIAIPEDGIVYCSGRDVTEQKLAEAQLAQTQEALRQSQKMEAIGQLTGGIAHDFNNLLAGIEGSLELLQKRLASGRTHGVEHYIEAAQSSAQRATALTQRLLAFSRRQTLDPKPTNANTLIGGVEELIGRTVGPGVALRFMQGAGLWTTRVDPSQLENTLLNLCINARDAMPHGGRITIETANRSLDETSASELELPAGDYVSLSVADTGAGMAPEVITQAFDPFFTTKPLGQGTGLGLSMTHGFVRQSGGQVRITSTLGQGTCLTLYFPRFAGASTEAELGTGPATDEGGGAKVVMVIDDEPAVRMLMTEVVRDAGYRVLEAADGPTGLKVLQSDAVIDFLVTDVGLPGGMNGRQVADAARAVRPDLRVLFVTGYAETAVVGDGRLEPGMQVITKPFRMAHFADKVREMIDA